MKQIVSLLIRLEVDTPDDAPIMNVSRPVPKKRHGRRTAAKMKVT